MRSETSSPHAVLVTKWMTSPRKVESRMVAETRAEGAASFGRAIDKRSGRIMIETSAASSSCPPFQPDGGKPRGAVDFLRRCKAYHVPLARNDFAAATSSYIGPAPRASKQLNESNALLWIGALLRFAARSFLAQSAIANIGARLERPRWRSGFCIWRRAVGGKRSIRATFQVGEE